MCATVRLGGAFSHTQYAPGGVVKLRTNNPYAADPHQPSFRTQWHGAEAVIQRRYLPTFTVPPPGCWPRLAWHDYRVPKGSRPGILQLWSDCNHQLPEQVEDLVLRTTGTNLKSLMILMVSVADTRDHKMWNGLLAVEVCRKLHASWSNSIRIIMDSERAAS